MTKAKMVSYFCWANKGIPRVPSVVCMGPVRGGIMRGLRGSAPLFVDPVARPLPHHPHPLCEWSGADLLRMASSQRISALSQHDQDELLQLSHNACLMNSH